MRNLDRKSSLEEGILELISNQGTGTLAELLEIVLNRVMVAEREEYLGAKAYERNDGRKDYANGFKPKTLKLSSGKVPVLVPQVRNGGFYPSALEIGSRSERALKLAVAEIYVQGVSTRKVSKIVETLCGTEISSGQVSRLAQQLDEDLESFRNRPLGSFPIVYLDAIYQKVRSGGCVIDMAVLIAIGVQKDGSRHVLGVSAKLSEAEVHWRAFFESLVERGLKGIELFVADDHSGLKAARKAVFPSVPWQRCVFHLAQNAQHHSPSHAMREEIAKAIKSIYTQPSEAAARRRIDEIYNEFIKKAPKFAEWLIANAQESLTFYRFPQQSWHKIRTSNMLERLNREIRRRTRVATLFPNEASCLRLITALLQEQHEEWATARNFMDMSKW